jgi:hypothetical protein
MMKALGGFSQWHGHADLAVTMAVYRVDISAGSEPFESMAARPAVA